VTALTAPRAADVARARADVYRLLGRLLLEEIEAGALPALRAWPAFGEALRGDDATLLARLRVEYARLFLMNVPPYGSVYADPDLMLNGEVAVAVERAYAEAGFSAAAVPRAGAPDHVGAEMAFMAHLATAEAAALERGRGEDAPWRARQRRFLERHLAAVLAPFAQAVARDARHPFYRAVADATLDFVLADLGGLVEGALPVVDGAGPVADGVTLAQLELSELARHLATPVASGLFLSREEIHRIAGRLSLSVSMLERTRMVEMLFEGAARFDLLSALLGALLGAAEGAAGRYAALAAAHPAAAPLLAPWRARVGATAAGLAAMLRQIA
jgi:TorA maturation chaperone TorD